MRVLFVMHYPGYLRYFDTVIRGLADDGHEVFVAFESDRKQAEGLEGLPDTPRVVHIHTLPRRADAWAPLARQLRSAIDYLRYLHPRLANASYLRRRMFAVVPFGLRWTRHLRQVSPNAVALLIRGYRAIENAVPAPDAFVDFLRKYSPDVVVVSPLVTDASAQTDVVKAASALGIPSVLLVASWDHLTTKGLLRVVPDRVVVWNDTQREEAEMLHLVPPDRIVVTGAQPFDKWFDRVPRVSMAQFVREIGLPDPRPFVLFVGSTASISEPAAERRFVENWLRAIRAHHDPIVRDVAVVVRPHPFNLGGWVDADLIGYDHAVVWPRDGANPVDERDRETYFLSLHYAAAVVGINTSAMIEAATQGKPVLTVRAPEFRETQDLTLHFQYLLPDKGGFLQAAGSLDEHLTQLAGALREPDAGRAAADEFIRTFVRPHDGLAATAIVVSAVETVRLQPPLGLHPNAASRLLALALAGWAAAADIGGHRRRFRRRGKQFAKSLNQRARSFEKGSRRRRSLERVARFVTARINQTGKKGVGVR